MEKLEAPAARPAGLGAVRRKALTLSPLDMVKTSLPQGATLPLVIEPAVADLDLAGWAKNNRAWVQDQLSRYGAVLFRGFRLGSVDAFEGAAASIYDNLYSGYGDLPRAGASENIYTSTPYPPDKTILFHNESSHLHSWPMKISFYCVQAAQQGGETPLLDCREVCRRMRPELLQRFAERGLMYVRNFSESIDVSWRQFFHTDDQQAVEETCRKENLDCEWTAKDGLRIRHRTHAVVRHPRTHEIVFFNQIQLHHIACLDPDVRESLLAIFREEDLPRHVYYGDGSPIEDAVIEELGELYWKTAVQAPWQDGDMVMLDNMLAAHARNPYVGPRKIVVAMGEMIDGSALPPLDMARGAH